MNEQHKTVLEKVDIIGHKVNSINPKVVEVSFTAINDGCVSQLSREIFII